MTDLTIDIPLARLATLYLALLVPIAVLQRLGIRIGRDTAVGVIRMSAQLAAVGLYLKYLFTANNPWLNFAWVGAISLVANHHILQRAGLSRRLFWPIFTGVLLAAVLTLTLFLAVVVRPDPLYDARYLIPLAGMVLGNCLRSNVIALERFYNGLRSRQDAYLAALFLGATVREATLPYLRRAASAALAPNLATMSTMGLVSLPGMMTGQILGGAVPLVAIKYQVLIMLGIFFNLCVSLVLTMLLSQQAAFNEYGLLRDGIFRTPDQERCCGAGRQAGAGA